MEHFCDAGRVPHIFVRFNPDEYTDPRGKVIPSCWTKTPKTGEPRIAPSQERQWGDRLQKLAQIVHVFLTNKPEREVTVIELFYR